MLANHINKDALDGNTNYAPSLPSSTPAKKKKKHLWNVQTTPFMSQPWVCVLAAGWGVHTRPLIRTECGRRLSIGPQYRKLYVCIHQPVRFPCREAVFTARYDLNL
jgi:hypothetical protein